MSHPRFDAVVIGAGAAGLLCAGMAGQRGLKVLLIDHAPRLAEKIRISGGGRCNFTNRDLDPHAPQRHYLSENPHFCRSALSRYTPADFIALLQRHRVPFHEKHRGQLFCDRSAQDIIEMLLSECGQGGVERWQPCQVRALRPHDAPGSRYAIETDRGTVHAHSVVVATGGLPVPKIGASDWGLRLATQFGLNVVTPRPGLVPLTFDAPTVAWMSELAGLAMPVRIGLSATAASGARRGTVRFDEDLLFTHRGLSGPAVLQISSYWHSGQSIQIDFYPTQDLVESLLQAKTHSRRQLDNELARWLPARFAEQLLQQEPMRSRPLNEVPDRVLRQLAPLVHARPLTPTGTEGYAKAEVMTGGVDTRELSSQTLEARRQPGLYFIGEVIDVTGWLGGYNFQWAWSSAHACASTLPPGF